MKNKRIVAFICFVTLLFSFSGFALAQSDNFGGCGSYYTECLVRLVPILNDIVKGYTGAYTLNPINNYAYVRVRIGESSSNYTQNTAYKYNAEYTGTIQAGWTNSHWAETYHLAQEFTRGLSADIQFNYTPR